MFLILTYQDINKDYLLALWFFALRVSFHLSIFGSIAEFLHPYVTFLTGIIQVNGLL